MRAGLLTVNGSKSLYGNYRTLSSESVTLTNGRELRGAPIEELTNQEMNQCVVRTLNDAHRALIITTLRQSNWVVGGPNGAAARLGLKRTTRITKMRRLGISTGPAKPVRGCIRVRLGSIGPRVWLCRHRIMSSTSTSSSGPCLLFGSATGRRRQVSKRLSWCNTAILPKTAATTASAIMSVIDVDMQCRGLLDVYGGDSHDGRRCRP
jgi:hypothetical protein